MLEKIASNRDKSLLGLAKIEHLFHQLDNRKLAQAIFEGLNSNVMPLNNFVQTYLQFVTSNREKAVLKELEASIINSNVRRDNLISNTVSKLDESMTRNSAVQRLKYTVEDAIEDQNNRLLPIYSFLETNLTKDDPTRYLEDGVSEPVLEETACLNILNILEIVRASENYNFYAQGLDDVILDLIHTGRYQLAAKVVRLMRRHASKKNEHEGSRQIARQILSRIRKLEIADELIQALRKWGKKQGQAITMLLTDLGPVAFEPLLGALRIEENRALRVILIDVVAKGGQTILPRINEYLKDPNWFMVRNMIALVSRMDLTDKVDYLQINLDHEEARVRKEVARALTTTSDIRAVSLLEKLVLDPNQMVQQQAILCLAHFKGSEEAAAALIKPLAIKNPFNGDLKSEQLAIETLGKINHPSALPTLAHYLMDAGRIGGRDDRLLTAAAKAIARMENQEARGILEKGSKSKNKTVRMCCEGLIKKAALTETM